MPNQCTLRWGIDANNAFDNKRAQTSHTSGTFAVHPKIVGALLNRHQWFEEALPLSSDKQQSTFDRSCYCDYRKGPIEFPVAANNPPR